MNIPQGLSYTKNDEWIKIEDGKATIGITDYAQDQLSDIVYLEINLDMDVEGKQGDLVGSVESVKAAADLYLPASGKIIGKNDGLSENPEVINSDPYGDGWIIKIALSDENEINDLMNADAYQKYLEQRDS